MRMLVVGTLLVALVTIVLFCVKIWRRLLVPTEQCYLCMVKKVAVITGGNRGMGYYVALDFARRGAKVILACKNKEKAEEARQKIIEITNNSDILVKPLNLASFSSIKTFAHKLIKTEKRLDILVNNAGILKPNSVTEDGYYTTLQVNALGPFLLTYLLLDLLKSTRNSRVINVTTLEGTQFSKTLPNLIDTSDNILSYIRNYNNSKKCLNILMMEMAERLKFSNVSILFSLPKLCKTDFHFYPYMPSLLVFIRKYFLFYFFYLNPEESVLNTIYCALSDKINKTGVYYRNLKEYTIQEDTTVDIYELRNDIWNRFIENLKLTDI